MAKMEPFRINNILFEADRLINSARNIKSPVLRRAKSYLRMSLSEIFHYPPLSRYMSAQQRNSLMLLRHRLEKAVSKQDLQDILRDLKMYTWASPLAQSTASQTTSEMRERIQTLENKILETPESIPEIDKVITVTSLKEKSVLFAIMPFASEFQDVWIGGIKRAANGTGFFPVRIDMLTKSTDINDDIVNVIKMSKIVVVDVTNKNPNVMFELGYALACKKPHVIISQSNEFLPFDIQNIRTLIYRNSWQGIEDLHRELQKFIKGARKT